MRIKRIPTVISNGKMMQVKIPAFSPVCAVIPKFCAISETIPASHGPAEAPISPKTANMANMAFPPSGNRWEHRLNEPGHIILTDNPHTAQPARLSKGKGEKTVTK